MITNYDIAAASGLWATDVHLIAARVGATEYVATKPALENGRSFQRSIECYTLTEALRIVDYVRANPHVAKGGIHAPTSAEVRIEKDFNYAFERLKKAMP